MKRHLKFAGLLLAGLGLPALPSQAQPAPSPLTSTRPAVETARKLRLEGEAGAWRKASAKAMLDHARRVASSGAPRDLLAAATVFRSLSLSLMDASNATATPQQETRVWFDAAMSARPRDRLVAWYQLDGAVFYTDAPVDTDPALAFLLEDDTGNAAVHLQALRLAETTGDTALAQRHWEQAAASSHYDAYTRAMGAALLGALHGAKLPPLSQELSVHMSEGLGLDGPMDEADALAVTAMVLWSAIALPSLQQPVARCTPQAVAAGGEQRRGECLRVMSLLADDESSLIMPMLGLKKAVELSHPGIDRQRRVERLREVHWLREAALKGMTGGPLAFKLPPGYLVQVMVEGELPAMRRLLEHNGIALEPPSGWVPEDPAIRALL